MTPSQLSAALRRIASQIDASERPDRVLVSRDLRRVVVKLGSYHRTAGSSPHVVVWDELGMVWSDLGTVQIQGGFGDLASAQRSVIEANRAISEEQRGIPFEEDEEEDWTVMSVTHVSDLSKVKPTDHAKGYVTAPDPDEEGDDNPWTATQDFLVGPGYVAVCMTDRHYSIMLLQP